MKTEAETGVTQPRAKGVSPPPEARRTWNRFSLEPPERNRACQHLDFRPLELGENTSLLFSTTPFLVLVVAALRSPARLDFENQDSPCQTRKSWLL